MSLRKKLEGVVGGGVEIVIPPADPTEQIRKNANMLGDQLSVIIDDGNRHRQRAEQLMLMLQDANRQIERLVAERNEAHRQFLIMLHGNGHLKSMIEGIASLIHNGKDMLHRTDHLLAQQPKEGNDEDPVDLGEPRSAAPEPTIEEIEKLRGVLANL